MVKHLNWVIGVAAFLLLIIAAWCAWAALFEVLPDGIPAGWAAVGLCGISAAQFALLAVKSGRVT